MIRFLAVPLTAAALLLAGPVVPAPPAPAAQTWASGASGDGAASGDFGRWRGSAIAIGGTWNDSYEAQRQMWSLWPGMEWGSWQGDLDVAMGAIYRGRGETWAKAAGGAYDARWRASLSKLKSLWGDRPGTVYLRFAHEFNGNWTPWRVTGAEADSFVQSWRRFRAIQQQVFPEANLVFCPNDGSSASLRLDWRRAFPGADYVDTMGVDSYNAWPYVDTPREFAAKIGKRDRYGAPLGIETHRAFAASVGLPFAVPEWGTPAGKGDSAAYVEQFASWVRANAGTGPGQVSYEIYFNVGAFQHGTYQLFPSTRQPVSAAAYRTHF